MGIGIPNLLGRWRFRLLASFTAIVASTVLVPSGVLAAPPNLTPGVVDASIFRAPTTGQVVANGTLADSSGRATSGKVAAVAWPAESLNKTFKVGDRIPTLTVGWATAGVNGAFTLRVDRSRVPSGYLSPSGQLDLVVFGWNSGHLGQWSMSTTLSSAPTASSLVPMSSGAGSAHISIQLKDSVVQSAASISGTTANAPASPDVVGCYYVLKATYNALDNVAESYPYYYTTMSQFAISYSHGTTLGAATSTSGSYGSYKSAGSYSSSAGVGLTWAQSSANRIYQVQTEYGKYQNICTPWLVKPIGPTGGTSTAYPGWANFCGTGYVVPESGGVEFKRYSSSGYHFSESGGVQTSPFIGINLSVDSNYSTDTWVSYTFGQNSKLCGSNTWPANAGRINENPYA